MKKGIATLVGSMLLILSLSATSWAQTAKYKLDGRVGYLSNLDEEYESTAVMVLDFQYSFTSNIGLRFGAGFTNLQGPDRLLLDIPNLMQYLSSYISYRVGNVKIDQQYFYLNVVLSAGKKRLTPYICAGVGLYQFIFRQTIFGLLPIVEEEEALPLYWRDNNLGMMVGGGVDYYMTEFLSLKFEGLYQKILNDFIKQQFTFTAGFGFNF